MSTLASPSARPTDSEAARLAALREYNIVGSAPEEAFDALTALAAQLCGVPASLISLVDDKHVWSKSGYGLPAGMGAALAAPDRPVLSLESDGSAMYTISGLWTQARENLNVTTVIYNNGAYDILRLELQRVGAGSAPGPKAQDLLDLSRPTMDFVKIAEGMGVPARRATTVEEFADALHAAFAEPGPHLIDAVVPSLLG